MVHSIHVITPFLSGEICSHAISEVTYESMNKNHVNGVLLILIEDELIMELRQA